MRVVFVVLSRLSFWKHTVVMVNKQQIVDLCKVIDATVVYTYIPRVFFQLHFHVPVIGPLCSHLLDSVFRVNVAVAFAFASVLTSSVFN